MGKPVEDAHTTRTKSQLIEKARGLGFDVIHITKPDAISHAGDKLEAFVRAGYHGDMAWMAETLERRKRPQNLWPDVKSIVMLGMNYGPETSPLDDLAKKERGLVSVYARGKDYHDILKSKLKQLASWLHHETQHEVKVFVDTAPVMEKPLAQAAGLGWQGKHTNLVSREFGSWLFLGSIFTTAELPENTPEQDHCGSCRKCLDICPTDAFPTPYQLDARRCLAYLTIEHKGHIPEEFRKPLGNRIFGCDDCLAICPWNKYAKATSEILFANREATHLPPLEDLLALNEAEFRKRFAGTPVKRTGWKRFLRNVLIGTGNSGNQKHVLQVVPFLNDESSLVRAMAIWACKQLMTCNDFAALRREYFAKENDTAVSQEWG
ncbi:MAG: tRNA epoxyqueuosine(34) reductase QueG [Pseudomonadota bacterium]